MTDTPAGLDGAATMIADMIRPLKSAPYIRAAIQALANEDIIPWINSSEGQEVKAVAVGFVGKLFGGIFAGPAANGIEAATDQTIEAFVAIACAPPK